MLKQHSTAYSYVLVSQGTPIATSDRAKMQRLSHNPMPSLTIIALESVILRAAGELIGHSAMQDKSVNNRELLF